MTNPCKKAAAILLVCSMFTGSMLACSESAVLESETQIQTVNTGEIVNTPVEEETEPDVMAHLGTMDWQARDFIVLGDGPAGDWQNFEVYAEEMTGEAINDSVFERNLFLRDTYNVNLVGIDMDGFSAVFQRAISANTDDYQACLHQVNSATSFALQGMLYDFNALPVMDLDHAWYDQNANKSLSVANRLYFSFGDMNLQNLDLTWCVMFNKELADNYQVGDIYSLVENNEWTMEKLMSLTSGVSKDLNGDGTMDKRDLYGACTTLQRTAMAFMYAAGIKFVEKDTNDYPVYKPLEEITYNVFSDILRFYHENDSLFNLDLVEGAWKTSEQMFMNDQILFYIECLQNVARFRDMEVDFGVVPMPKYTVEQDNYISMVCDFPGALVIPSYCTDTEFTGFMVEALNAKSSETVRPTYVDKCLMYKYTRDEESSGMVEIILDTMYYDPAYIYSWGNLVNTIGMLASKNYDMLASQSKSLEKKIVSAIEKTIETYKENQ